MSFLLPVCSSQTVYYQDILFATTFPKKPNSRIPNVALIGTNTGQLEVESRNNQGDANIVVQAPTNLPDSDKPVSALPLRFYLPIITR